MAIKVLYYDGYSEFDRAFETYIFADSHGHMLEDCGEEFGIFNFSDPSDSYMDMLRKVKYTIAHSKVKRVILSADRHTLTTYREANDNRDRSAIYATQADYESSYQRFLERYVRRYIPLLHGKSRDALLMHIKRLKPKTKNSALDWVDKTSEERERKAKLRAEIHFGDSERSEKMEQYLLEILSICEKHHIEVVGLKFPLTPSYRSTLSGKGFHTDSLFIVRDIPVIDFTNIFDEQPDLFRDQDHLNEFGAKEFTFILTDSLETR
ncbi:MAG: hypothetical protein AAFP76_05710 [Bacteroidota bacterium]